MMVMAFHFPKQDGLYLFDGLAKYGFIGVDLFFVLSGYLIGLSVFSSMVLETKFSLILFYVRRLLRTLPSYYIVVAIYFLWPAARELAHLPPIKDFLTLTVNYGRTFGAFSHAWSLCVEEHFYLIFPLLALAFYRFKNRKLVIIIFILFQLAELLLRYFLWSHNVEPDFADRQRNYFEFIYYPTWTRLDGLIWGVGLAALSQFETKTWSLVKSYAAASMFFGVVLCLAACLTFQDRFGILSTVFGFTLLSAGFACILLNALSPQSILYRIKVPGAGWAATLSYSLYLVHKSVFHLMTPLLDEWNIEASSWTAILLLFAGSVVVASLLHLCVERPFLLLRERIKQRSEGLKVSDPRSFH